MNEDPQRGEPGPRGDEGERGPRGPRVSDDVLVHLVETKIKLALVELRRDLNGSLHRIEDKLDDQGGRVSAVEATVGRFEPAIARVEAASKALQLSRRVIVAIVASGGVSGFALLEFLLRGG